jgi:hypothetical protein
MFNKIRNLIRRFFRKSSTLNRQSLNVPSLIVIVLVDIFILANVFFGLNDISNWHLSPAQAYPCYSQWQTYRESPEAGKDYAILRQSIVPSDSISDYGTDLNRIEVPIAGNPPNSNSIRDRYQRNQINHLGQVSAQCIEYAGLQDALRTPENRKTVGSIDSKLEKISQLEQTNRNIRAQYDSTLLEKVAGQPRSQSINTLSAEQAKQKTDTNSATITQLKQDITELKQILLAQPVVQTLLVYLKNPATFDTISAQYRHASFWYPSIQLAFQTLFLLPLILISYAIHRFALRKNYGLVALITWHLLIIATIPALLKVFEFLQVGVFFQWIATAIGKIFGNLLFLVSYSQIVLIPLVGFGLIKLIQRLSKRSANAQTQAANRIAQSRCLRCAKKIGPHDAHCAHCGYQQYAECPSCHAMTHRQMPHCIHCGSLTQFDPELRDPEL